METFKVNNDGTRPATDEDQAFNAGQRVGVTSGNNELVTVRRRPSWTDRSGVSAAAAVTVASATATRVYVVIQNISDTDMWIGIGTTATTDSPSIKLAAGATWEPRLAPTQSISIHCTSTGKKFTAKEAI